MNEQKDIKRERMRVKTELLKSFFDAKGEGSCCSKKTEESEGKETEFKKKEVNKMKDQTQVMEKRMKQTYL